MQMRRAAKLLNYEIPCPVKSPDINPLLFILFCIIYFFLFLIMATSYFWHFKQRLEFALSMTVWKIINNVKNSKHTWNYLLRDSESRHNSIYFMGSV